MQHIIMSESQSSPNNTKKRPHPDRPSISNSPPPSSAEKENPNIKPKEAITKDGEMPQKRFYRSRAHCNPLSHNDTFDYPKRPDLFDWTVDHYPNIEMKSKNGREDDGNDATQMINKDADGQKGNTDIVPTVLDIGCGFGGLTTALATILPDKLILGLEIRAKVTEYVRLRILALRKENPGQYENCSVLRSNTMKLMPHFFRKHSLDKIFFCFPDPHFKKKNHSRRIVSERLLSEYAYLLNKGGRLYTITDVEDLHSWHLKHCRAHPMFRELSEEELKDDPCVKAMYSETEEGKKVERAGTKKYYAVYEKLSFEDVSSNSHGKVNAENFWN